jgi:hypothetical protein
MQRARPRTRNTRALLEPIVPSIHLEIHMSHDVKAPALSFTTEQMQEAVKKLIRAGKALGRSVETCLVMAVYDSIANKSPVVANALIGALRTSTKKQGIVAFLEKFGQLYDRNGKFVHFALGTQENLAWDADYSHLVQEEAESWESFKPAPKSEPIDMVKGLEALIKRGQKEGAEVIDADLIPYMQALLAQYAAKKALDKAKAEGVTIAKPEVVAA